MNIVLRILCAALALLPTAVPASATIVKLETAVALTDRSESAVDAAIRQAVETAVRGVAAMGLSTMRFNQAVVLPDRVVVSLLATDEVAENESDPEGEEDNEEGISVTPPPVVKGL
jgi:hypothetical protein